MKTANVVALAFASLAAADDYLYSSRVSKRGLLPNGNYNLCMPFSVSKGL